MVDEADDLILIASNGVIIRISVADISVQSRYAQGVRVMRVPEGERVVTMARTAREEEENGEWEGDQEEPSADTPALETPAEEPAE